MVALMETLLEWNKTFKVLADAFLQQFSLSLRNDRVYLDFKADFFAA